MIQSRYCQNPSIHASGGFAHELVAYGFNGCPPTAQIRMRVVHRHLASPWSIFQIEILSTMLPVSFFRRRIVKASGVAAQALNILDLKLGRWRTV